MQQLIDVLTVIKSSALISAAGAIGIPCAWPECRKEEKMKRRWRAGDGVRDKRDGDGYGRY